MVTTDFFTPVVDEPYAYGAIAAANSLSDIYAMGAKPFLALNVAALPPHLPSEYLSEIIRGGAEKAKEAGVVIVGGHTVQDKEPKFGLVALGFVKLDQILTKGGAKPGDRLVITKPLGLGVITSAVKKEKAARVDIDAAIDWMMRLNDGARELAVSLGLKSGTDVTGFSLMGHAWEMAQASRAGLRLEFARIPILENAWTYARAGTFPGGAFDNKNFYGSHVCFSRYPGEPEEMLLYDPQTSGGLLLAVPAKKLPALFEKAAELGQPVWEIGEVIEEKHIEVI